MRRNRRKPKDGARSTLLGGVTALCALALWIYFDPLPQLDPSTLDGMAQPHRVAKLKTKPTPSTEKTNTTGRP